MAAPNELQLWPGIETAQLLPEVSTREEWLAQRRAGLGGSDAAVVLDASPFRSQFELYLDKTGEAVGQPANEGALFWGSRLEPVIVQVYAEIRGVAVHHPRALRSLRHPFMQVNLDGLAEDKRIVEAKTSRTGEGWGDPGTDQVPLYYLAQAQHAMAVTGLQWVDFPVLIGGQDFRIYHVQADPDIQAILLEREAVFWERHVLRRVPPPTDGSMRDVQARWGRRSTKGHVLASEQDLQAIETLRTARRHLEDIESTEENPSRAWLMQSLGERGDTLVDKAGRVLATWKLPAAPKRFDAEAFAAQHPELYQQYLREGTASRRFLLK